MSKERQPVTLVSSVTERSSPDIDTEDDEDSDDDEDSESLQRVCSLVICQTINDLSHTAESITNIIIIFSFNSIRKFENFWDTKTLPMVT